MTRMEFPPLVLLPGSLCDERVFAPQLAAFEGLVPTVVADLTMRRTFTQMAADILATAPPKFAVVGLSMGGIVAVELLRQAPERVVGLALADTNISAAREDQIVERSAWSVRAEQGELMTIVRESLLEPMTLRHGPLDDVVLDMARSVGPEGFVRQNEALIHRADLRPCLPEVRVPTLVVTGDSDRVCPMAGHLEYADLVAGSELVVIPDCGHLSTLDRPEVVSKLLMDWLRRLA